MTCRGCLFVKVDVPSGGDIDGCRKEALLDSLKSKYADNKKAMLFLEYEASRLREGRCAKRVSSESSLTFEQQLELAYDDFEQYLKRRIAWVVLQPPSVLRRKFRRREVAGFALRMHCCWIKCPDKNCASRKRGRHCPKQKKISHFLEVP